MTSAGETRGVGSLYEQEGPRTGVTIRRAIPAPGTTGEIVVASGNLHAVAGEGFVLVPPRTLLDPPVAPLFLGRSTLFQKMGAECVECGNLTDRLIKGAGAVLAVGGALAAAPTFAIVLPSVSTAGGLKVLAGGALLAAACEETEPQKPKSEQCTTLPSIYLGVGESHPMAGVIKTELEKMIATLPEGLCSAIKKIRFVHLRRNSSGQIEAEGEIFGPNTVFMNHFDNAGWFEKMGLSHLTERITNGERPSSYNGHAFDPDTATLYLSSSLVRRQSRIRQIKYAVMVGYGARLASNPKVKDALKDGVLTAGEKTLLAGLEASCEVGSDAACKILGEADRVAIGAVSQIIAHYVLSGHLFRKLLEHKEEFAGKEFKINGKTVDGDDISRVGEAYVYMKDNFFGGREYNTSEAWGKMADSDLAIVRKNLSDAGREKVVYDSGEIAAYREVAGQERPEDMDAFHLANRRIVLLLENDSDNAGRPVATVPYLNVVNHYVKVAGAEGVESVEPSTVLHSQLSVASGIEKNEAMDIAWELFRSVTSPMTPENFTASLWVWHAPAFVGGALFLGEGHLVAQYFSGDDGGKTFIFPFIKEGVDFVSKMDPQYCMRMDASINNLCDLEPKFCKDKPRCESSPLTGGRD